MFIKHSATPVAAVRRNEAGLTVLELMIASSVFIVILLILAIGVIGFTNSYYRGITSAKTQSATRLAMAQISQAIQFGGLVSFPSALGGGGVSGICVNNTLFAYKLAQEVTSDTVPLSSKHQGYHALLTTHSANCSSSTIPANIVSALSPGSAFIPNGTHELLGQHMRLAALTVTVVPGANNLYSIHLRVVYGDDDLLQNPTTASATCLGGIAGYEFCSSSDLTTTVEKRITL